MRDLHRFFFEERKGVKQMRKKQTGRRIGSLAKRLSQATLAVFSFISFSVVLLPAGKAAADSPSGPTKRVIVRYKNVLGANSDGDLQEEITGYASQVRQFKYVPFGVYNVDTAGEQSLVSNGYEVFEDKLSKPFANLPIPAIGGDPSDNSFTDSTTSTDYDGSGYAVAVLDTGVDKNHSFLSGKVVAEACFSTTDATVDATSLCPGGVQFSEASGSGADCDSSTIDGCGHGTHVAGVVAMDPLLYDVDSDSTDDLLSGVATGADIVAVQVFTRIDNVLICGIGTNPCVRAFTSDQIAALEWVLDQELDEPIVSANMSLGHGAFATAAECRADGAAAYDAIAGLFAQLRSARIAPVVATGNDARDMSPPYNYIAENANKISSPACVEGAVAVSSSTMAGDGMSTFAQNGPLTTLLAPGGDGVLPPGSGDEFIWSLQEGTATGLAAMQGTSQATPLVAGAFAVLREKHPSAGVGQLVGLLQESGTAVNDTRPDYTVGSKKMIDLSNALSTSTKPEIVSFTGPDEVNEGSDVELTIEATNAESCNLFGEGLDYGVGGLLLDTVDGEVTVPGAESYSVVCSGEFNDTDSADFEPEDFNNRPTVPNAGQALSVVKDETARSATIAWEASEDPDGIEHYEVYLDGELVDTTNELSYTFTDLGYNIEYTAEVYAVDTLGARSLAASTSFLLEAPVAPEVPDTGLLNVFENISSSLLLSVGAILSTGAVLVFGRRYL